MFKTKSIRKSEINKTWVLVDVQNLQIGRVATRVAAILMGKHKVTYTPHMDCGDHVVVINASQIVLTGKKMEQKKYRWHTGYPGGLKERSYKVVMNKDPSFLVTRIIRGMLPKGPLGRAQLRNLHVYDNDQHSHSGQSPSEIKIKCYGKDYEL